MKIYLKIGNKIVEAILTKSIYDIETFKKLRNYTYRYKEKRLSVYINKGLEANEYLVIPLKDVKLRQLNNDVFTFEET